MTPEQIEEHNRIYREAAHLAQGEIILQERRAAVSVDRSTRTNLERALKLFARVLEIHPENWSAMWFLGKIHQRLGNYPAALTWFVGAHGISPSQHGVTREASICAMHIGRSQDAFRYALAALQAQPSNFGLQANLALALLLANRLDEAKSAIDISLVGDPSDVSSQTIRLMVQHFIAVGQRPPSSTPELEVYWKTKIG